MTSTEFKKIRAKNEKRDELHANIFMAACVLVVILLVAYNFFAAFAS